MGLILEDGPTHAPLTVVLAHGAGAPMDHPFMEAVATGLAAGGLRVLRVEFPYMRRRRTEGVRAGPNPLPALQQTLRLAAALVPPGELVLAGKSMGGRVAATLADALSAQALVVFGYPLHPAGQRDRLRLDTLQALRTPTLILQGERDPMGDRSTWEGLSLPGSVEVAWVPDGEHSLKPRLSSGHTLEGNLSLAVSLAVAACTQQRPPRGEPTAPTG
ncbi:MAG: alpha/beta hydrolase [Deltaproteobacteria bacterium]|nr:alpha/beta hydrolase [Deltaproteobacteria bacterium]